MFRRLLVLVALAQVFTLTGCIPTLYPGYFGRIETPLIIPMDDSTRTRNTLDLTVEGGGGGAGFGDEESNGYASIDLTTTSFKPHLALGMSFRGMAGRIDVGDVPGFHELYYYFDLSPLFYLAFYGRAGSMLFDGGLRTGAYFETGPYAEFRRDAGRMRLIDREFEDAGAIGNLFWGIQGKVGNSIIFWQSSVGWPVALNTSIGLSRGRHSVSLNMRPADEFAASLGYSYGIY